MVTAACQRTRAALFLGLVLIVCMAGCGTRPAVRPEPSYREVGLATYYAHKFHGRTTANGERYDENAMTAAHRHLPFGTVLQVTNLGNRRSVMVRINDRGPFIKGRIIDLSFAAAKKLGMLHHGVVRVEIAILTES